MNLITIIGNLTRDPETRTTPNGYNVCNFTVAVNRRKSSSDEADFFQVNAWKKLGESCQQYLAKGRKVAVSGAVHVSSYTTSSGEHRAAMVINADEVEFLSPKQDGYTEAKGEDLPWK